ncbi:MAG: hypothetical protein U0175_38140 [Caldilineaceae bacterium]
MPFIFAKASPLLIQSSVSIRGCHPIALLVVEKRRLMPTMAIGQFQNILMKSLEPLQKALEVGYLLLQWL